VRWECVAIRHPYPLTFGTLSPKTQTRTARGEGVAVRCIVLQRVAVRRPYPLTFGTLSHTHTNKHKHKQRGVRVLQCVPVRCEAGISVVVRGVVRGNVVQMCCRVLQCGPRQASQMVYVVQCVAACGGVLQVLEECCNALQGGAVATCLKLFWCSCNLFKTLF